MPEIVSEVTSRPGTGGIGNSAVARPVISNSVAVGGAISSLPAARERGGGDRERAEPSNGGTIQNEVKVGGARVLSDSARKLFEVLDKPADDKPAPTGGEQKAEAAPAQPAAPPLGTAPAQPVAPDATTPPPAQPAAAPHAAELERMLARNRELVEENARLKSGGAKRELGAREKALDEIERTYLDNPRAAVRRLAALALGHEDPQHADVTAEMKGLLQELFSDDAGVPIDSSQQAIREAARTRHMLVREQRERRAEAQAASAPPESSEDKQAAEDTKLIGTVIANHKVDGKAFAERYPLTAAMSQEVHGVKPDGLLLKVIYNGFATGEFDRTATADKLVEQAARKTEDLYQALGDKFSKARPQPSTAQPTPAPEIPNKQGQEQAARSITNASASVAPATPPAKAETSNPQPPKRYRTEEERRQDIIRRRTGD